MILKHEHSETTDKFLYMLLRNQERVQENCAFHRKEKSSFEEHN